MSFGPYANAQLKIRHKVFVSYHHKGDQAYYDSFSKTFHDAYEAIYDNSLNRKIGSDDVDYVIRKIREDFITGTSCTIVLCGKDTWGRKFVDWEIYATLEKQHGLVGVQLPTLPISADNKVTVPDRLHLNIASGFAVWVNWADITSSSQRLGAIVADAKSRRSNLIDNSAERRMRNA